MQSRGQICSVNKVMRSCCQVTRQLERQPNQHRTQFTDKIKHQPNQHYPAAKIGWAAAGGDVGSRLHLPNPARTQCESSKYSQWILQSSMYRCVKLWDRLSIIHANQTVTIARAFVSPIAGNSQHTDIEKLRFHRTLTVG